MFDEKTIEVPCPHCHHKQSITIGEIKTSPEIECAACFKRFRIDSGNIEELDRLGKAYEDTLEKLARAGWKVTRKG